MAGNLCAQECWLLGRLAGLLLACSRERADSPGDPDPIATLIGFDSTT